MKILGIIILAACPTIIGFNYATTLKKNRAQIEKIIQLINWLITEIRYNQTELTEIIMQASKKKIFKNLDFMTETEKNMQTHPFPIAWENSVINWNTGLSEENINLLSSMSNILGASDSEGQIMALEHLKIRFEQNFEIADTKYKTQGKISKSLSILTSLAIFIIMI